MFRLLKSSLLIFILALSTSSIVDAQSIPGVTEPIVLKVSSRYPMPNTSVTVTAESFSTDLDRADFTWTSGGKTIKQGRGATSVTVPSGKSGTLTSVSATVVTTDIGTISQTVSWRPADVTLVWKSDGYTPPFYKGKALEAYGASFRVTAIPEFFTSAGNRMDPKTLVYRWTKNGTVDPDQSGYGKDSYAGVQTSYVRGGDEIAVEVSSSDGSVASTKKVMLSPGVPEILFYEESPLYGVQYEKALPGTFEMSAEEVSFRAEPFHASVGRSLSGLSLDWSIDGSSADSFKDKNRITLRKEGALGGQSAIGLIIQHQKKILQGGTANITILR